MVERSDMMFGWGNGCCLPPIAPLTIPGVYSDTLSYEDNLAQIMQKINELIIKVNSLTDDTNKYTDEQILILKNQLEKEISTLKSEFESYKKEIIKEISELEKSTQSELTNIRNYIDVQIVKIEGKLADLKLYIDTLIFEAEQRQEKYTDSKVDIESIKREIADNGLQKKIDEIIRTYPKVYNAVLGIQTDVQTAFNSFYKYLRELGILSIQYDNLQLTAEDYDNLKLQAHEFDVYSGYIFAVDTESIRSPFTGKKEEVSKVLYDLIQKIRWNADTASYFDVYSNTAKLMDESGYTANYYETNNIKGSNSTINAMLLDRRYSNTVTGWKKSDDSTTQGWFNSQWLNTSNNENKNIHSFTLVIGRKGKVEEINILFDLYSGQTNEFDITDFTCNNEKQVAYVRHIKIGLADIEHDPLNYNTFSIGDCTANSLSYSDLSHETYIANDNLVVYELRVNYNSDSYNNL